MNKSQAERLMKEIDPSIKVRMITVTKTGYCIHFNRNGKVRQKTVKTEEEFNEFLKELKK